MNEKMQMTHKKGKAYQLADAIAWCNKHGKKIKQCKEMDLRKNLREKMERELLK